MSRLSKSIGTTCKLVVARSWGCWSIGEVIAKGTGFLLGVMTMILN